MFCRNCGKEMNETQKFCPYCGQKVGGDTAYPSSNGYPQTAAVVNKRKVSAKYSCGFSNLLDSSIIVNER